MSIVLLNIAKFAPDRQTVNNYNPDIAAMALSLTGKNGTHSCSPV